LTLSGPELYLGLIIGAVLIVIAIISIFDKKKED